MQKILLKVQYFERGLSESLKNLTLFFLSKSVPFNGQSTFYGAKFDDEKIYASQFMTS